MGRLVTALALVLALAAPAGATPPILSHRGLLTLADGRMAADGLYEVEFSIHDAPTGGSVLFVQRRTVHVDRGIYEVYLSEAPGAPLVDALSGAERYLQLTVVSGGGVSDQPLAPRQRIAGVPYALVAGSAEELESEPAPLPTHAIVLWDQATGCGGTPGACPCGFDVASEFAGRTFRGADSSHAPGTTLGTPGGPAPDGDVLGVSEMPPHTHLLRTAGEHRHPPLPSEYAGIRNGGSQAQYRVAPTDPPLQDSRLTPDASYFDTDLGGSHQHVVQPAGDGGPHYHPLRTVLFCRKQ